MASKPTAVRQPMARARATAPRRFGVPGSSRSGLGDQKTRRHHLHHAAAHVIGIAMIEERLGAHQYSHAVRRVHLVGAEGDEVEVFWIVRRPDVDGPVGGELGAVGEEAGAVLVRQRGDLVDRRLVAGDVRGPADRHHPGSTAGSLQLLFDATELHGAARVDGEAHHPGHLAPRQIVRVVLGVGEEHHVVGLQAEAPAELVDHLGGVLAEDDGVVLGGGADELEDPLPAALEDLGRQERLVAGAAVHRGVRVEEAIDGIADLPQGRRRGRVVEVDVAPRPPQHRHLAIGPDAGGLQLLEGEGHES
jgi:hypothetical protein